MADASRETKSIFDSLKSSRKANPLPYDHLFKIIVIGDYGSGKTCLIHRFIKKECAPPYNTLAVDFLLYTLELDLRKIKLQIWDIVVSPHSYQVISISNYRGAKGIMMAYDVTNRASFESIRDWKRQVDTHAHEDTVLMLIGNKCDLQSQRQVSIEEGKKLAAEFGIWFMETSALEDVNVEQAFVSLTQDIKQKVEANPPTPREDYKTCCLS